MSWCPVSSTFLAISKWTLQPKWLRAGVKPVLPGPPPVIAEMGTNLKSFVKINIHLKEINILLNTFIQRSGQIMSKGNVWETFPWLLHQNLKQTSVCCNHPVPYQGLRDQIFHPERSLSGNWKIYSQKKYILPFLFSEHISVHLWRVILMCWSPTCPIWICYLKRKVIDFWPKGQEKG